jgi:trehalose-phosphatase
VTPQLVDAVHRLATAPVLLVACDYDGTLAELVDDPDQAWPVPEAIDALRALASLPDTEVAVVSGRALRDLAVLTRLPPEVRLIGSHGAEHDAGSAGALEETAGAELEHLGTGLAAIAESFDGARLEHKPASVVLHYRTVAPEDVAGLLEEVDAFLATEPGLRVLRGKQVVELLVVAADKGTAIVNLRDQLGAVVLFVGDDLTDEDAFAALGDADLGVKVGPGLTRATQRVADPPAVAELLGALLAARQGSPTTANARPT